METTKNGGFHYYFELPKELHGKFKYKIGWLDGIC
jgi:hypothetical protein